MAIYLLSKSMVPYFPSINLFQSDVLTALQTLKATVDEQYLANFQGFIDDFGQEGQ